MRAQKVFVFTITARKTIGTQEGQGYNGEWTALGYLNWWALSSPDLAPQHLFEVLNCQMPGLRSSRPNHPIMHQLLWGPMEPTVQTYADNHLDQVHFARPHEVKWEPVKRAVMPVTIGCAGGCAGVEATLE